MFCLLTVTVDGSQQKLPMHQDKPLDPHPTSCRRHIPVFLSTTASTVTPNTSQTGFTTSETGFMSSQTGFTASCAAHRMGYPSSSMQLFWLGVIHCYQCYLNERRGRTSRKPISQVSLSSSTKPSTPLNLTEPVWWYLGLVSCSQTTPLLRRGGSGGLP